MEINIWWQSFRFKKSGWYTIGKLVTVHKYHYALFVLLKNCDGSDSGFDPPRCSRCLMIKYFTGRINIELEKEVTTLRSIFFLMFRCRYYLVPSTDLTVQIALLCKYHWKVSSREKTKSVIVETKDDEKSNYFFSAKI